MSDATSQDRPQRSSSAEEPQGPLPEISTGSSGRAPAAGADQPTVISSRPPLSPQDGGPSLAPLEPAEGLNWGDRLGHFELVGYAGGGGMGRVFRATDTRLARTVALKVLSPDQAADVDALQRFENEARAAARLDHTNIARVYFVGEDRGLHFIAFEFVEGTNVRDIVQQSGPLPLDEALSSTLQVAEALAHAADRNVVHRDIKPSNIIVTPERRAKLVDMGLARRQHPQDPQRDLTASGVTLGTFDYISPEQARDPRSADVRSDIYSLGCTFFFMLTGRPPFPEGTVLQKLLKHQADEPPEIRELRPDVPEAVSALLRKMLAKEPRRRHQHPAELVEDLTLLARQLGLQTAGADGQTWTVPAERKPSFLARHIPWAVPVTALVATVASLELLWSSSYQSGQIAPPPIQGRVYPAEGGEEAVRGATTPDGSPGTRPKSETAPRPGPTTEAPSVTQRPGEPGSGRSEPGEAGAPGSRPAPLPEPIPDGAKSPTSEPTSPGTAEEPSPGEGATQVKPAPETMSLPGGPSEVPGVKVPNTPGSGEAGTSPDPSSSPAETPAAKSPVRSNGALIVDPQGDGANVFPNLRAACGAATGGDEIVLRYSGRVEEQPFELAGVKLTIRAAEGSEPVVVFRPAPSADPGDRRSMLTVAGSQLRLIGIALELETAPEGFQQNLALIQIRDGAAIRLQRCVLTVRGATNGSTAPPQLAFIRVAAESEPAQSGGQGAEIQLDDSIVRGDGIVVRTESPEPLRLAWDNGLLATRGPLLDVQGAEHRGEVDGQIRVDLSHLTAWIPGGLCRMAGAQTTAHQALTQVSCSDSILLGTAATPLVEQIGVQSVSDLQNRFGWDGSRNFYEGWDRFWVVRSPGRTGTTTSMGREAWEGFWGAERESQPHYDAVIWEKRPAPDRPLHLLGPTDFQLSNTADNPALGASRYGPDAGCQAEGLPPLLPQSP